MVIGGKSPGALRVWLVIKWLRDFRNLGVGDGKFIACPRRITVPPPTNNMSRLKGEMFPQGVQNIYSLLAINDYSKRLRYMPANVLKYIVYMYYMQDLFVCDINSYIDIKCVLYIYIYIVQFLYQFLSIDCGIQALFRGEFAVWINRYRYLVNNKTNISKDIY